MDSNPTESPQLLREVGAGNWNAKGHSVPIKQVKKQETVEIVEAAPFSRRFRHQLWCSISSDGTH